MHIDTSSYYDRNVGSDVISIYIGTTADANGAIISEHLVNVAEDINKVL